MGEPALNRHVSAARGFSKGKVYERAADDWYVEPVQATLDLLDRVRFTGSVWDPACGGGNVLQACRERGIECLGTDIAPRPGAARLHDFLADAPAPMAADNIICNPPYGAAEAFILKALRLAPRKVAMITRLAFMEGQARRDHLFLPHPPARVLVFSRRLSMPPGGTDIKPQGGAVAYCWLVWDAGHDGATEVAWI